MAGLLDLATRAQRMEDAVTQAERGRPAGAAAPVDPARAKLEAELTRLRASTDPISAEPRKRRIAKIQTTLAEMDAAAAAARRLAQSPGRVRTTKSNKYVTNESTRDEVLDQGTAYPLHRLSRERTPRSEAARHVAAEAERVARLFGK